MLSIKNLHACVEECETPILKGLNLDIKPGEVHAIMGPNGSGKSTLSNVIAGNGEYEITDGSILFNGEEIGELEVDERAAKGIFMAFQYPVEIPGITNMTFLKTAKNAILKANDKEPMNGIDFVKLVREKAKDLNIREDMLKRSVNDGFSGGEKKRNEMLQMSVLDPNLVILDETDSGLDIDALKIVAEGVNNLRDGKKSFVIITHYQRLLDYIKPDVVHVLANGQIQKTGDASLALELEQSGYQDFVA